MAILNLIIRKDEQEKKQYTKEENKRGVWGKDQTPCIWRRIYMWLAKIKRRFIDIKLAWKKRKTILSVYIIAFTSSFLFFVSRFCGQFGNFLATLFFSLFSFIHLSDIYLQAMSWHNARFHLFQSFALFLSEKWITVSTCRLIFYLPAIARSLSLSLPLFFSFFLFFFENASACQWHSN